MLWLCADIGCVSWLCAEIGYVPWLWAVTVCRDSCVSGKGGVTRIVVCRGCVLELGCVFGCVLE